jgi:hypothetical protein
MLGSAGKGSYDHVLLDDNIVLPGQVAQIPGTSAKKIPDSGLRTGVSIQVQLVLVLVPVLPVQVVSGKSSGRYGVLVPLL